MSNRIKILIGLSFVFFIHKNSFSQVSDSSFSFMLHDLLTHSVKEISVKNAALSKEALFLDAREAKEFQVSHLMNAMNVGYNSFDIGCMKSIPKDRTIIVYCSVGYRSEKISEKLNKAGYKDVSNLYGGIFEWVNEGHPVYDMNGKQTSSVHAYDHSWGVWLKKGKKVY